MVAVPPLDIVCVAGDALMVKVATVTVSVNGEEVLPWLFASPE
jgi:hypothetical protein